MAISHVANEAGVHPNSALQHHFDNMEQQREAGSLGMWVFLAQEVMFFGGLFLAYVLYRNKFPGAFAVASNSLDPVMGGINTVVLICSSLTMALAVYYAQTGVRRKQIVFLLVTMAFGVTFLVIKGLEYADKFREHHIPVPGWFDWDVAKEPLPVGVLAHQVEMFFWIYFAMTGLHALHMIIGLGIMTWLVYKAWKGTFSPEYHGPVEVSGLYWHFVDIVWIFLFPLLYLLGRHLEHH